MKICYEPHPVSSERKAELRAQGFKIIDARFAPDAGILGRVGRMKKPELARLLAENGVEVNGGVADMRAALVETLSQEAKQ